MSNKVQARHGAKAWIKLTPFSKMLIFFLHDSITDRQKTTCLTFAHTMYIFKGNKAILYNDIIVNEPIAMGPS